MTLKERKKALLEIFEDVEETERKLIEPLIDDVAFLENKMLELKALPFINVNPKNRAQQKTTAAAKLYKECSQSHMNAIRILLSILNKADVDAAEELRKRLEEF